MKKIVLLTVLSIITLKSFSWGDKGHRITAAIAKKQLAQNIIDSVKFYLGKMSFENASVWMDEVRKDTNYDYLKPRHYINVAKGVEYEKQEGDNIVNELNDVINKLRNRSSKKETAMALKILFHLMGDLHQPLHCGYAEDKGGNTIQVAYFGHGTNLHKVWDTEMIEQLRFKTKTCMKTVNLMGVEEKKKISQINVEGWMLESRSFLPGVYNFSSNKIERDYVERNKAILQQQLINGGLRLAAVLAEVFSKS
jgi:hypothetical protein